MNKKHLQNERLDRIGRKLLEAARVSDDEIEKIVRAPHLFDSIKTRIKAEELRQHSGSLRGLRRVFIAWNWQKASVAFASLIVIFSLIGAFVFTKQDSPQDLAARSGVPEIQPDVELVEISQPQPLMKDSAEIKKTKSPASRNQTIVQRAVFKKATAKLLKPQRKANFVKRQTANEPSGDFYAVTYAGNPGEAGEDMQIIRAELSRSSLFALGVNLPVENETAKVKTEMLISSDGVVRGIRWMN